MAPLPREATVGVVGAGTMGAGIAQVAALAGHPVRLFDELPGKAEAAVAAAGERLRALAAKGRLGAEEAEAAVARLEPAPGGLGSLEPALMVLEAVVEDLEAKRRLFAGLETVVPAATVLATNTSSLSVTALAAGLRHPERVAGMHFFNPAPVMELVEVVSGLLTDGGVAAAVFDTAAAWGKTPVHARNTPGFVVNRVARPFYGEGLRLLAEGAADAATLDAIFRDCGGFRMGPFELTDLIGQDVNLAVTRSVYDATDQDPRYRPSPVQRELVEAGRLGRKAGRGFYAYGDGAARPEPAEEPPGPRPGAVVVEGGLGPAEALAGLAERAGLAVERAAGDGAIRIGGVELRLTDGACAAEGGPDRALFDLALDYAAAPRVAVAGGDRAVAVAAGFFQALGKRVTRVADLPGLVVMRTVAMLAAEAADAVALGVASGDDVDLAMRKGVKYPLGPLAWAGRVGFGRVVAVLDNLSRLHGEDRYRCPLGLRRRAWAEGAADG